MKVSEHLNYVARLIKGYRKREICLAKALKCKREIEKINFFDDDFYCGGMDWGDFEDDNWVSIKFSFLEENSFNDDEFDFLSAEIDFLCTKEDNKYDDEFNSLLLETKDIFIKKFSNAQEMIKNYKLYQFSSWFDEPDNQYKFFMEHLHEHIENQKKELAIKDKKYSHKLQKLLN